MSISKKLGIIFTGILLSFSVLLLLFSSLFLNSFYSFQKRTEIVKAYENIYKEVQDKGMSATIEEGFINDLSINSGLKIVCFDENGDSLQGTQTIADYSLTEDGESLDTKEEYAFHIMTEGKFFDYKTTDEESEGKILRNLALVGKIVSKSADNNILGYVIIYTPSTQIKANTRIFGGFILYATIVFLVIGVFVISIVSNRFTKPLKEVEKTTKNIANLDFSTKLDISSHDEVGSLALSINKMSNELEKNISELKEANAKLEKDLELESNLNQMRQNFISDVSHELKTPISIIAGYSEALKLEGVSEEDLKEYSDIIIDETKKMNKLVRNLIKYTQVQSGLIELEKEDFNLRDLIDSVIFPYNLEIKERQIDLRLNIIDAVVNGDFDLLTTVFSNFFSNAMHYVDHNRIIEINTELINDKVKVSVRNTGINIDTEDKDRIWESFYKADKARTRKYGGSGLGLSIVKTIMEQYNNEYGFENVSDGVIFYFYMDQTKGENKDE